MISSVLATADLFGAALRSELPNPLANYPMWMKAWTQFHERRRFRGIRADLYRDLAAYILDGTDPHDAIASLLLVYTDDGKTNSHPAVAPLRAWSRRECRTMSLPALLAGWAPSFDIMMIQAGEMAGASEDGPALPRMLERTITQIETEREMMRLFLEPVWKAAGGLAIGIGYICFLALATVPAVRPMLVNPQELGSMGSFLLRLTDFLQNPWSLLTIVPLSVAAGWIVWSFDNWTGPWRQWVDRKIDFYTIYKATRGATFLKALAPLLAVGKSHREALEILSREGNPYERHRIGTAAQLADARGLGESLKWAGHEFPDRHLILRLIAVDGRKRQAEAIEGMADRHLGDTRRKVGLFGFWVGVYVQLFVAAVFTFGFFAQYQISVALTNVAR